MKRKLARSARPTAVLSVLVLALVFVPSALSSTREGSTPSYAPATSDSSRFSSS
jgi:hypothetical protein